MKVLAYIILIGFLILTGSLWVTAHFELGDASAVTVGRFESKIQSVLSGLTPIRTRAAYESLPETDQERLNLSKYLPDVLAYDRQEIATLLRFAETCDPASRPASGQPAILKSIELAGYFCGLNELREKFFETAPYIHPLGRSFVARANQQQPGKFDSSWLNTHKAYLHVVEYRQIVPDAGSHLSDLIKFSLTQRRAWVDGAAFIVGNETFWVLSSKPSEHQQKDSTYDVYSLDDVNRLLGRIGLVLLAPENTNNCLITMPGYCLQSDKFGEQARRWAMISAVGSAILMFIALLALFSIWSVNKRKVRKERMMILQILAHELRTPVTSMGISLELLRNEFDRLTPEGQSAFLRMADDNRRLIRLIDGSRSYLTSGNSVGFVKEKIDLVGFLTRIAQPYEKHVTINLPEGQIRVETHPDWLGICIVNLLENATRHGVAPVVLSLEKSGSGIELSVEDCGHFSKKEYLRLKGEFRRGTKSSGMGLGLSIVLDTLTKLGHALEFRESPTRFTIKFEEA